MPVSRKTWKQVITKGQHVLYPCPTCTNELDVVSDSISIVESREDREVQKHEAFEPDWLRQRFTATLRCLNPICRETVVTLGWVDYTETYEGPHAIDWQLDCHPTFFHPALPVIKSPDDLPEDPAKEIERAFALHLCDPAAAVNRIRTCIERILDDQRIPSKSPNGSYLTLHKRLEQYAAQQQNSVRDDMLLAIKWIGNEGTHGEVTEKALYDAFDLAEYVMHLMYDSHSSTLQQLSQQINRARGSV